MRAVSNSTIFLRIPPPACSIRMGQRILRKDLLETVACNMVPSVLLKEPLILQPYMHLSKNVGSFLLAIVQYVLLFTVGQQLIIKVFSYKTKQK